MFAARSLSGSSRFKRRQPLDLLAVGNIDEVVTCLPVIQEVLQGFSGERAFRIARESMVSLPVLDSPWRSP